MFTYRFPRYTESFIEKKREPDSIFRLNRFLYSRGSRANCQILALQVLKNQVLPVLAGFFCVPEKYTTYLKGKPDVPQRETSPAAKSEEKRVFSQATG